MNKSVRKISQLTHVNPAGLPTMVSVADKPITRRTAVATATVHLNRDLAAAIKKNSIRKGRVLEVARLAGIQAAKKTAELIPLCHPIPLESVEVDVHLRGRQVRIRAAVSATWKTGVEMEALTAAAVAALTVYDMGKAIDRTIRVDALELVEKTGGTHGDYFLHRRKTP